MDTKLKKSRFLNVKKGIAFLVVVISFAIFATFFLNLAKNINGIEQILDSNYVNSNELRYYQQNFYIGLNNLLNYKSEDNILRGKTINKEEFESRKKEIFYEWYEEISNNFDSQYFDKSLEQVDLYNLLKERFEAENAHKINELYNNMLNQELRGYYDLLQRVNNKEGLLFYATNGENVFINTNYTDKAYFSSFKAYFLSDKDGEKIYPSNKNNSDFSHVIYYEDRDINNKIYIAVTDEFIAKNQSEWDSQNLYIKNLSIILIASSLIMLIALLYLIIKAGKKDNHEDVQLIAIDRLYTDLNLFVLLTIIVAWISLNAVTANERFLEYVIIDFRSIGSDFWAMMLLNIFSSTIVLTLFLSLVRNFKNKTLVKKSLIYILITKFVKIPVKVFTKTKNVVNSIINLGPLSVRFIYYSIFKSKLISSIINGIKEIKEGNLEYVITAEGNDDLSNLANDINSIANGLKKSVEKEIKAERMKSELITNVSHDLKTPLTSIINYADLLSKEKLEPNKANEYVSIIKQKSEKLKLLTQDLFEISKVQSGNITVDLEKIDVAVLIKQSLAEIDEQISISKLNFKVNAQDNVFINADGKRLSRVFENLISNILKYSLKNTRVYIDVYEDKNNAVIEFKNIANYEMNFKEDEIVERFMRGDNSRTTEGNGLGLAIAQSYVNACGGKLDISVDGDLFKVIIRFDMV